MAAPPARRDGSAHRAVHARDRDVAAGRASMRATGDWLRHPSCEIVLVTVTLLADSSGDGSARALLLPPLVSIAPVCKIAPAVRIVLRDGRYSPHAPSAPAPIALPVRAVKAPVVRFPEVVLVTLTVPAFPPAWFAPLPVLPLAVMAPVVTPVVPVIEMVPPARPGVPASSGAAVRRDGSDEVHGACCVDRDVTRILVG